MPPWVPGVYTLDLANAQIETGLELLTELLGDSMQKMTLEIHTILWGEEEIIRSHKGKHWTTLSINALPEAESFGESCFSVL